MSGSPTQFKQLTWGVKESFRGYVEGAEGSISLSNGATKNEDGTFTFPAVAGGNLTIDSDGNAQGEMRFAGTVNFEAHGGMLNSTLTELGLEATDDGLALTVLDTQTQNRCPVATLSVANIDSQGIQLNSQITMDGMYVIADNYPPGTELDVVILQ